MADQQIINTLCKLHGLLSPIRTHWFVIGTASLMLAGFDVEPNDIDILCDKDTALQINSLLSGFEKPAQLKDEGKFRSAFSRYVIDGVSIELMGDLEVNTLNNWVPVLPLLKDSEQIILNDLCFNIPSNATQITIYELFGRKKDLATLSMLAGN